MLQNAAFLFLPDFVEIKRMAYIITKTEKFVLVIFVIIDC